MDDSVQLIPIRVGLSHAPRPHEDEPTLDDELGRLYRVRQGRDNPAATR